MLDMVFVRVCGYMVCVCVMYVYVHWYLCVNIWRVRVCVDVGNGAGGAVRGIAGPEVSLLRVLRWDQCDTQVDCTGVERSGVDWSGVEGGQTMCRSSGGHAGSHHHNHKMTMRMRMRSE